MNTPIARRRRPSAGRDNIQEISRRLTVGGRSGDVPKHRQPNVPHVELAMFAVTAMLVCYALEDRSPWFVLSFAGPNIVAKAQPPGLVMIGVIPALAAQIASAPFETHADLAFKRPHDPPHLHPFSLLI